MFSTRKYENPEFPATSENGLIVQIVLRFVIWIDHPLRYCVLESSTMPSSLQPSLVQPDSRLFWH